MIINHGAVTSYYAYKIKDESGNKTVVNPRWTKECGYILDIKGPPHQASGAKKWALALLLERIKSTIPPGAVQIVTIIPGHRVGSHSPNLVDLARTIAARIHAQARPDLISRVRGIEKLAHGGDRSLQVHLASLEVQDHIALFGQSVLLVDDVRTTGHSMDAASRLLIQAGAKAVHQIAIGQTE